MTGKGKNSSESDLLGRLCCADSKSPGQCFDFNSGFSKKNIGSVFHEALNRLTLNRMHGLACQTAIRKALFMLTHSRKFHSGFTVHLLQGKHTDKCCAWSSTVCANLPRSICMS